MKAAEVVPSLYELEMDSEPTEAETIARTRRRFEETFELDAGSATYTVGRKSSWTRPRTILDRDP